MRSVFFYIMFLGVIVFAQGVWAKDLLPGPIRAEVLRVIDGDTLDVSAQIWLGQYIQTRVRLSQIDTPELRGRCAAEIDRAQQAKKVLADIVKSRKIWLKNIHYGKYAGRILAQLETDQGVDPVAFLIEKGLARPYDGKKRSSWCP
ncbi:MAG: thermonuclease family protein [Terasakiella sp.]|uniref:thermonuclease family protein n=1 Tax=unclassified Terasakiella TaxID=2614952 RepID=UPI003AFFD198